MKVIKYKILGYSEVCNPETEELELKESFATVTVPYSEDAAAAASTHAYNGEYTVEDNEQPEPDATVTDHIINALLGVSV